MVYKSKIRKLAKEHDIYIRQEIVKAAKDDASNGPLSKDVIVSYHIESDSGRVLDTDSIIANAKDGYVCTINCPNNSCSSKYFDLRSSIITFKNGGKSSGCITFKGLLNENSPSISYHCNNKLIFNFSFAETKDY